MNKEKMKKWALKHPIILKLYRNSFGLLKTKVFFGMQMNTIQKKGYQLLSRINTILDNHNAVYFVDCGTLLGLVRDQRFIPYDRDIDYGIYYDENFTPETLAAIMNDNGFKKVKEFRIDGEIWETTFSSGIVGIDFFRHSEECGKSVLYGFHRFEDHEYPNESNYSIVKASRAGIKGINSIIINGIKINIPSNYKEYLQSAYTEHWMTPDPNWTYDMEPSLSDVENKYAVCFHSNDL